MHHVWHGMAWRSDAMSWNLTSHVHSVSVCAARHATRHQCAHTVAKQTGRDRDLDPGSLADRTAVEVLGSTKETDRQEVVKPWAPLLYHLLVTLVPCVPVGSNFQFQPRP